MSPPQRDRLPNAMLLGAAKCGTTSLAAALGDLDGSFVPRVKEPHFFDRDEAYALGSGWYREFFSDAGDASWAWDCTPNYFHRSSVVIPRLVATYSPSELGALRFVVVLRDPVQRAYSHYLHQRRVAAEDRSFRDAISTDAPAASWSNYRLDSEYGRQLSEWFAAFDQDRFLVVIAEDFDNYDQVLARIAAEFDLAGPASVPRLNEHSEARSARAMDFLARPPALVSAVSQRMVPLGVRQSLRTGLRSLNLKPAAKAPIDDDAARTLREYLAPDQQNLAASLGRDLPWPAK